MTTKPMARPATSDIVLQERDALPLRARLEERGAAKLPPTFLPRRLQSKLAHIQQLHGPQTLGSLADLLSELSRCPCIGRKTLVQLGQELEQIAAVGPEQYLYGSAAPPTHLEEFVTLSLATLTEEERWLMVGRIAEQRTLLSLAQECGVTRERIRQRVILVLDDLHRRFRTAAQTMTEPLLQKLRAAGGLLHQEELGPPPVKLGTVLLALALAGYEQYYIWQEEFLTDLSPEELQARVDALRPVMRAGRRARLSIEELQELTAATAGLHLGVTAQLRFMVRVMGVYGTSEQGVVLTHLLRIRERLVGLLRDAGKPLHLRDLARALRAQDLELAQWEARTEGTVGEASNRNRVVLPPELPEPERRGRGRAPRSLVHRIGSALQRAEEVYRIGIGTYVHVSALPVPLEQLQRATDWCVRFLEGTPRAVSSIYLLDLLRNEGLAHPQLTHLLLKDALQQRLEIMPIGKTLVGYATSFQEYGLTLDSRMSSLLLHAGRPLTWVEVHEQLHQQGTTYSTFTVQQQLASGRPYALVLGNGRYLHMQRIGLTPAEQSEALRLARQLLPADGTPLTALLLLRRLHEQGKALGLQEQEDGPAILWGLLRRDPRCEAGYNQFIRLRQEGTHPNMLQALVLKVLGELQVGFPRDLRREIGERYLYEGSGHGIDEALQACLQLGQVCRLPPGLYFVTARAEEVLPALAQQAELMEAALGQLEAAPLPPEQLELLARALSLGGRDAAARQVRER